MFLKFGRNGREREREREKERGNKKRQFFFETEDVKKLEMQKTMTQLKEKHDSIAKDLNDQLQDAIARHEKERMTSEQLKDDCRHAEQCLRDAMERTPKRWGVDETCLKSDSIQQKQCQGGPCPIRVRQG